MRKFRHVLDRLSGGWMLVCLCIFLLIPLSIALGLVIKSFPILQEYSFFDMVISSEWAPMRGEFGFYSFIMGSLYVTGLSFVLVVPVCMLAAIYLTQYAPVRLLKIMFPVIDILAGIPSVVYGVWGILVVVPFVSMDLAPLFGAETNGFSILSASIVLAVMCIPYVLNMLIEVFRTIPLELKEASLSLGATYWETIKFVLLRKAAPGIVAAFGLGISKAFGETIAVLMVVGNVAQVPKNMLDAGYTLPSLIANNYGEMMSIPSYDSALTLAALVLFGIVLFFNVLSRFFIYKAE